MAVNPAIVLALLGDLMLGRGVSELIPEHKPEHFWGTTLPVLRKSDAVIANLECAITTHNKPWTRTDKVFHFRSTPGAVKILTTANIRAVSLANNHVLDFEEQGLKDTLQYLHKAGIKTAGSGINLKSACEPAILKVKGLNIAMIAFTDNEPPFAAAQDKPGTAYMDFDDKPKTTKILKDSVKRAKSQGADFIILSLHWGPNWDQVPSEDFRNFAHAAIDLGVDLIHGHSAHIVQGVEFYKDAAILYSCGDFIDDYAIDPIARNDWSYIFQVILDHSKITKVLATPVKLSYAQTNIATGEEAQRINKRMTGLCQAFGTTVEQQASNLVLRRSSVAK